MHICTNRCRWRENHTRIDIHVQTKLLLGHCDLCTCMVGKTHTLPNTQACSMNMSNNFCSCTIFTLNDTTLKRGWMKQLRVTSACTTWSNKQSSCTLRTRWQPVLYIPGITWQRPWLNTALHCYRTRMQAKKEISNTNSAWPILLYLGWLKWIVRWKMNIKKEGPFLIRRSSWSHYCR